MDRFEENQSYSASLSPFYNKYQKAMDLARRAEEFDQLFRKNHPSLFLAWAERIGLPVPEVLKERVASCQGKVRDWKKAYDDLLVQHNKTVENANASLAVKDDQISELQKQIESLKTANTTEKPLQTRERNTALRLIVGMAMEQYQYDGDASKSSASSQIVEDLQAHGISIDGDTVRKWLQEGWENVVPGEAKPKSA